MGHRHTRPGRRGAPLAPLPPFTPRRPGLTRSGPRWPQEAAAARGHQPPEGDGQSRGRHGRRHLPVVSAGSGSGASLVRRRTGPAGNIFMHGRRTPAARGPTLSCSDVLGGCGELCDQAVRSAGTREGRGGRGAQVRTPPIPSGSVWPLPQPCSAQTRAEPPGTPPGRLREEFALLTPPSPDRGSGGARLPPKGNLATSRPGAARPGFGPLGNLFFSRPEIPPPPELSLLGPASVPLVPSPACSQPSSSSVHFVNVCI